MHKNYNSCAIECAAVLKNGYSRKTFSKETNVKKNWINIPLLINKG